MPMPAEAVHSDGCEGTCGGWYVCAGCFHVCGWCNGAGDDMPDHCDDCWFAYHQCDEPDVELPAPPAAHVSGVEITKGPS